MFDVADLGAMVTSLRAVAELTKLVVDAHDAGARREKSIELQGQIVTALDRALAAQLAQTTLLKQVIELEEEVADLKAWDAEKQKYQLTKLSASNEVFGYTLKEQGSVAEPKHALCANCFEDEKKSILQGETRLPLAEVLVCPPMRNGFLDHWPSVPSTRGTNVQETTPLKGF